MSYTDPLTTINNKITHAVVAGMLCSLITVIQLYAVLDSPEYSESIWTYLSDPILAVGLTVGVYKKSRICAVLLFTYYLVSKLILIASTNDVNTFGIIMTFFFLYYLGQGITGTFAYHKYRKNKRKQAETTGPIEPAGH